MNTQYTEDPDTGSRTLSFRLVKKSPINLPSLTNLLLLLILLTNIYLLFSIKESTTILHDQAVTLDLIWSNGNTTNDCIKEVRDRIH